MFKEVTVKHKGDKLATKYIYYEQCEADNEGIEYVYWKYAKNDGDWILTDDNIVVQVITIKKYMKGKKQKVYYRLPQGGIFWNPKIKNTKLSVRTRSGDMVTMLRDRTADGRWKNYATTMAITGDRDISIETAFGSIPKKQFYMFRKQSKMEEIENMVRREIEDLLKKHEMGADFTMELLSETITLAKEKGSIANLLRAIENLQDLNGMREKNTVKTTKSIQANETMKYIDSLGNEQDAGSREVKMVEVVEGDKDE